MTDLFRRPLPPAVRILEVGPRDGLQNQPSVIPVQLKAEWIGQLARCGFTEIEATSFVHPRWVPQLADASQLMHILRSAPGPTTYSVLVPNLHGLEDALKAGVDHIALFTAASETFNRHNVNCSIAESLRRFEKIFQRLEEQSVEVRAYISTCFGCPYEGEVGPERVAEIARTLHEMGAAVIAVSDTTGIASPPQVCEVVETMATDIPLSEIALHFHDTHGLALTNVLVGLTLGVTQYDASAGGLGGCPYAPGAAGNLATEDLVYLLHSLGIQTGIDLDALIETSLWFETHFLTPFPGRVLASRRELGKTKTNDRAGNKE